MNEHTLLNNVMFTVVFCQVQSMSLFGQPRPQRHGILCLGVGSLPQSRSLTSNLEMPLGYLMNQAESGRQGESIHIRVRRQPDHFYTSSGRKIQGATKLLGPLLQQRHLFLITPHWAIYRAPESRFNFDQVRTNIVITHVMYLSAKVRRNERIK